jgi:outer membrane autotransporter protein
MDSTLANAGDQRPAFPVKATAVPETTFWIQGVGAWGNYDGVGNAADMRRTLAGFFSGVDRRFSPNWLAGFAGGYTNSSININDRASSANIDTAHLAGYVAANKGSWNFRTSAAASFSGLGTSRAMIFPGFVDTATTAHNGATTTQIFSEVSYGLAFGQIAAEPFAGLAFVHLSTDSFAESRGTGSAALSGSGSSRDIGYSTLGGRVATNYALPNGRVLTLRGSAAWEHAFGSVTPAASLAFQSTGAAFTIAGVPLARDSALVGLGLDVHLNQQATLGLFYSSQLGSHVQDNSVQGNLNWRF